MIISASRRTDIPAFYSEWFYNRIRQGYVYVRQPRNPRRIGKVMLDPQKVECLVFWTKNPAPLMRKLELLQDYAYYFHFTLNPYHKDIEPALPCVKRRIETFLRLSEKIGPQKVIWRYDPVLLNETYSLQFHADAFGEMARQLHGAAEKCMVGFVDHYRHVKNDLIGQGIRQMLPDQIREAARVFSSIAGETGLNLENCTEKLDLSSEGIPTGVCIDRQLIERITGFSLNVRKDPNQRPQCGCAQSIDIGAYDSCTHGCLYCYANASARKAAAMRSLHDPHSPLLLGQVEDGDIVNERDMKVFRTGQLALF